jgi:oxygen-independent coproporphyrinogen-3 oxidase
VSHIGLTILSSQRVVSEMEFPPPTSAYLHVPFCLHKCGYCDFTVIAGRNDLIGTYLECLEKEIRQQLTVPQPMKTLFIGGGTPSLLSASELERLFSVLREWLPLEEGGEFSIECNPEQLTVDRMSVMRDAGVNRVSLGVQSFHDVHLRTLERSHTSRTVEQVVDSFRRVGINNISLDLIFAVPGQTFEEWRADLMAAIALEPHHISTYGLTYEKGTAFWTRRQKNQLQQAPEELERNQYALAMELLPASGYLQYELSNCARPGWESRHNRIYWQGKSFYGFGPGAAAFINGTRTSNHRSVTTWIRRLQNGQSPVQEREPFEPDLRRREAVMLGLRQIDGIDRDEYQRRNGISMSELAPTAYEELLQNGLIEEIGPRTRLTLAGRFIADTVIAEFL